MLTTQQLVDNLPDISDWPKFRKHLGGLAELAGRPSLFEHTMRLKSDLIGQTARLSIGDARIERIISHPGGSWLLDLELSHDVPNFHVQGTPGNYSHVVFVFIGLEWSKDARLNEYEVAHLMNRSPEDEIDHLISRATGYFRDTELDKQQQREKARKKWRVVEQLREIQQYQNNKEIGSATHG